MDHLFDSADDVMTALGGTGYLADEALGVAHLDPGAVPDLGSSGRDLVMFFWPGGAR